MNILNTIFNDLNDPFFTFQNRLFITSEYYFAIDF
ncbi:hypothetical protein SAMN05444387_3171 [Flavobacterium pectinovorum]|uniref:Uncharacterized protein n=1 Tax=Flavobacterium pectinovorum TaxID=29533 RepID=A0ABY1J5R4_9FLAO|nr:hypothetical protein SAMN05444387_3171 [Flavobacterium pectinovorum]